MVESIRNLFTDFGKHCVKYIRSEPNLNSGFPHVIIMDTHYSRVFNFEFLSLMKSNNIHVFVLSSLPPLDRVPFGYFKQRWNDEMKLFTRRTQEES